MAARSTFWLNFVDRISASREYFGMPFLASFLGLNGQPHTQKEKWKKSSVARVRTLTHVQPLQATSAIFGSSSLMVFTQKLVKNEENDTSFFAHAQ